jgi:hypothetical protein
VKPTLKLEVTPHCGELFALPPNGSKGLRKNKRRDGNILTSTMINKHEGKKICSIIMIVSNLDD